jgi:SAM-dependent methyltransferase
VVVICGTSTTEQSSRGTDPRRGRICPICTGAARDEDSFALSPSRDLPEIVHLQFCAACDFLFLRDVEATSYRRYYASVLNDADDAVKLEGPDARVVLQTVRFEALLPKDFRGRMLDFGCGQGGLLRALADRFPDASFFGHDIADHLPSSSRIRFVPTLDDVADRFDVIVLSHVVEHLVDFEILRRLAGRLAPDGLMYVEVPDPANYVTHQRREFMYYIDRLHINHFSTHAMRRLLDRCGLEVVDSGAYSFGYKDGRYPAIYCVARQPQGEPAGMIRDRVADGPAKNEAGLDAAYRAYVADEERRVQPFRDRLAKAAENGGLLVYGGGDNFRRALRPGGPLHALPLLAVLDQRATDAATREGFRFLPPLAGLEQYPTAAVVVMVSQGSDAIVKWIGERSPGRQVFLG